MEADAMQTNASAVATAGIRYEAMRKSAGIAYVFWFLFWWLSAHRFYCGRWIGAVCQLAGWVIGGVLFFAGIGVFVWFAVGVWLLVDALLIPGWIRQRNIALAGEIEASVSGQTRPLPSWKTYAQSISPGTAILLTIAGCAVVGWVVLTFF